MQAELDIYEKERIRLCERYGHKNEDKGCYELEADKQQAFETAIAELQNQETDICADKIDLSGENIKISAREIMTIDSFIKEV